MSFVRPELAERLRLWREPVAWGLLLALGIWLIWLGYSRLAPLPFAIGLVCAAIGLGLLRPAMRRLRLRVEALGEGVVVIDEARIAYLGPRQGGFVDLPAVTRVEIVTRPHVVPGSAHAWVITAEDGTRLTIPLGAEGADRLLDALSPLPGIDFDAGVAAVAARGPGRTLVWKKAG
jgi:PAS domain-containing protein